MGNGKTMGKKPRTVLVAAVMLLLLLPACAPDASLPPTQSSAVVEIGNLAPLTGATSGPEQANLQALQDYIRHFNEAGGIPGVTVELLWVDTALQIPRFVSGYHRFLDRGVPIIYSDDTVSSFAIRPRLAKDRMPILTGTATATVIHPPGWMYAPSPTFGETSTVLIDYFVENWHEDRPPRIAYFGPDHYLGAGVAAEVEKHISIKGMNVELLPTEFCGMTVIDSSPQLLRIKDRGADLLVVQNIVTAAGPILMDAERLGLLHEMQFGGFEFSMGETLIDMVGEAAEGYLAPRTAPWFDETDVPGIKLIQEVQFKYHGKQRRDPEYMSGWLAAAILCETVKRGIEEVGIENLDGSAAKSALDSLQGFDIDGVATITYTPEQRRGSRRAAVYQVQEGSIVRVSQWRETPILVP